MPAHEGQPLFTSQISGRARAQGEKKRFDIGQGNVIMLLLRS